VSRIPRPYLTLQAADGPIRRDAPEVWEISDGKVVHNVAMWPVADRIPIEGRPHPGPLQVTWAPTGPATIWPEKGP